MGEWNTKKVLNVLWKGKYLIIIFSVVAAIFGYIYNKNFTKPVYTSTSSIILSVTNQSEEEVLDDDERTISSGEISLSEQLMNTYVQIIKSESVMNKVIENLNLNMKPGQLVKSINVVSESKSTVLKISVSSENPQQAVDIVNEIEKVFFERIYELYNIKSAKVLDEPALEKTPSNIKPKKYAIIGFLAGFVGAAAILLVREFFNDVDMELTLYKYNVKGGIIKTYLTYLHNTGQMETECMDNYLMWQTIGR